MLIEGRSLFVLIKIVVKVSLLENLYLIEKEDLDMKKKVAGILSVCMLLLMCLPAKATGLINSVSTGNGGIASVSSDRGTAVLSESFNDSQLQSEVDKINGMLDQNLSKALGIDELEIYDKNTKVVSKVNLSNYKFLTKLSNLTIDADPIPSSDEPVKIDFVCNNITSDIEVYVLHKCDVHGWELLESSKNENVVSASFHSASPVALVYLEKVDGKSVEAGVSPKTGENNSEIICIVAAVMLLGFGTFALTRSRKKLS